MVHEAGSTTTIVSGKPVLAVFGEVQTCLLPSRQVLDIPAAVELLSTVKLGTAPTSRERPVPLVMSPSRLEGVDCHLAQCRPDRTNGKRIRGIGTVSSRSVVVGGRILQASSQTEVVRGTGSDRRPWSHYLSKPGTIETISGSPTGRALADGYLHSPAGERPELASICQRMANLTRVNPHLDQEISFRGAATTRLRWAAEVADSSDGSLPFSFRLDDDAVRSLRITVVHSDIAEIRRFCEDLAVHDWLLTTISRMSGASGGFGVRSDMLATELPAVLDELVPLWMPGTHTASRLHRIWSDLEADPGFTRQWTARVGQLRDRMTSATLRVSQQVKVH